MSKNPIFDATLLDHHDLWGTSLVFSRPALPTYTANNWVPAPPRIKSEPTLKTFGRCLWWWLG